MARWKAQLMFHWIHQQGPARNQRIYDGSFHMIRGRMEISWVGVQHPQEFLREPSARIFS
jgi:hypothetical protein